MKQEDLAYTLVTDKPFDEVVAALETKSPENQFRVLHVHNVQQTLAEKGFQRGPLKIIEVCNAGFAHKALAQDVLVALFMPCKFSVWTEGSKTHVSLGRPSMISAMLPQAKLESLANDVETTLKRVMQESV